MPPVKRHADVGVGWVDLRPVGFVHIGVFWVAGPWTLVIQVDKVHLNKGVDYFRK
ncbi:hypothetical protein MBOE_00640 [Mycolicibacterium boenickei]|uniref:Uncharacterized protein n=1 Tax=Mycolicibacterium boenickei TaxID=146017 RepID=A0ABN5Z2S9_9MYCO|nr:hypothetical protein MBOE_00640 [Mycolicibacterium boenickei]